MEPVITIIHVSCSHCLAMSLNHALILIHVNSVFTRPAVSLGHHNNELDEWSTVSDPSAKSVVTLVSHSHCLAMSLNQ